jgi:NAD(P)-dependent dehydrogenase (short-subunit alcohol dehydrogenase family)
LPTPVSETYEIPCQKGPRPDHSTITGIISELVPIAQLTDKVLIDAIQVNAIGGNLYLYQAFQPLLVKSDDPKFISISTLSASLAGQFPIPQASYSISKVAVNMILQRIHIEDPKITAFPIHPGKMIELKGFLPVSY